jgi:hypothetical protein
VPSWSTRTDFTWREQVVHHLTAGTLGTMRESAWDCH